MVRTLVVVAAVVVGCGGGQQAQNQAMHSVRGYNDALRWQRLPTAAGFIAAAEREAFLDEHEELEEELRIDYYEISRMRPIGKDRAEVQVKYTWHMDNVGVVKDTTTHQHWERHGKRWVMAEEHRVRGDEMPGVAEPPETKPDDGDDALVGDEPD